MSSVLNVEVSCIAAYHKPDQPRPVNLLTWLRSTKYRAKVDAIRTVSDKKGRDKLKADLPAITPSGLFTRKADTALIRHSGLICLDIDPKGNEGITNYADLKVQLCHIKNVAYCGLSVSGTGYFVLIPIAYPDQHRLQFMALRELFQHRFGVRVDNTPDVSRLRGYSYDPGGYFNHNAPPFRGLHTPSRPIPYTYSQRHVSQQDEEGVLLTRLIRFAEAASEGQRHETLLKAATVAGGYVAAGRVDEQAAVFALEIVASEWPTFSKSQKTIRDGIRYGVARPIYPEVPTSRPYRPITPRPRFVGTVVEQAAYPGSILKPDEFQIERLAVEPCDTYPTEWDITN